MRGSVWAIVGKGAYLRSESGSLVGLADSSWVNGPLTIRVEGLDRALPMLRGRVGSEFVGDESGVVIDGRVVVDLQVASAWQPPQIKVRSDDQVWPAGLDALRIVLRDTGPRSGLGPLAAALPALLSSEADQRWSAIQESDPLLHRASRSLSALGRAWRDDDATGAARAAAALLGLGPGLTPSGDDLLMGLLAVLKWASAENWRVAELGESLRYALAAEAPARTTHLSARLLAHAAEGLLYEPAMELGAALFAGKADGIAPAAARLFEIGHSSGADMAVGILTGAACLWVHQSHPHTNLAKGSQDSYVS